MNSKENEVEYGVLTEKPLFSNFKLGNCPCLLAVRLYKKPHIISYYSS
jgi:hypothetical protein